jgi:hypothetical protein
MSYGSSVAPTFAVWGRTMVLAAAAQQQQQLAYQGKCHV